jgi:inosine-uridine nucleoside N-ribohydrolase
MEDDMTQEQYLKNLEVPQLPIDVVLDTDAYNEIDDQFAIAYLLKSEGLRTLALYAAPFFNNNSTSPEDGMERSYDEIGKLLALMGKECPTYRGSRTYLPDEKTPVESPAARDLVERAMKYSPEKPLYVVAIGAITNVASALLLEPSIAENIVIVWLGGHAHHFHDTTEFNMVQDIAAARVVFNSGAPLVQLPCAGVVSAFAVSKQELEHFLMDKNPLADYLARNTIAAADKYAAGRDWTRVIWDVTAVAWLKNRGDRFLLSRLVPTPLPTYERQYEQRGDAAFMRYVYYVNRDELMNDLFSVVKA